MAGGGGAGRKRVVFVCTGNICRSPTAEGIFLKKVADAGLSEWIEVDSAGTHGYHIGEAPDPRSVRHAANRGYDLSVLRARQFEKPDFDRFDLVLVMDDAHREHLARWVRSSNGHKLKMIMEYSAAFNEREVPDPYYGDASGFERVLDLLEDATQGLLEQLQRGLER